MSIKLKQGKELIKKALKKYGSDDPIRLAGSAAFFLIFALSPILFIILSVFGLVLDDELLRNKLYNEIRSALGEQGTSLIREIISNFRNTERNVLGTIIGIIVFLIASTTFFNVLQTSLNRIWGIKPKPDSKFLNTIKTRLISFAIILGLGIIFSASLLLDAGLSFLQDSISEWLGGLSPYLIRAGNVLISIAVSTLVFAMVYKLLPDVKISWGVTWFGALVTAILFSFGKYIIGYGLGASNIGAIYGAAGSIVILLLWIFYASIIFFLGAEITQQYAIMSTGDITPKDHAVRIEIKEVSNDEKKGD
ncbi:MAG: YihY/virulence factor BrkB family protein [Bacteroidales bacterium]|nr:YihY/virulence factor BrkB family protein [Bacteroidales bacterium]